MFAAPAVSPSVCPPSNVLLKVMSLTPATPAVVSVEFAVSRVAPNLIDDAGARSVVLIVPPIKVVVGPTKVSTPPLNVVVLPALTSVAVPVLLNVVVPAMSLIAPVNDTLYRFADASTFMPTVALVFA